MVSDGQLGRWNSSTATTKKRPQVDLARSRFYADDWKSTRDKIQRHFAGKARRPLALSGAIASSDRLIKDDQTLLVWRKISRQIVAIEMESAGIYKATQDRSVLFVAIRGISDVVGFQRDPGWTTYACEAATAFARAFLLTRPVERIAQPGRSPG